MIVRVIGGDPNAAPAAISDTLHKNVSCQTDFKEISAIDIPIFFCTLFASVNEAATHCCIPAKSNRNSNDTEVNEEKSDGEKLPVNQVSHLDQTIEAVIRASREDDDSLDSSHSIDHFDTHDTDPEEGQGLTEKRDSADERKRPVEHLNIKEERNSDHETKTYKKVKGKPKGDKRKKGDSDFSSDDDTEFWRKMKKKMKMRRSKYRKHLKPYKPFSFEDSITPTKSLLDVVEELQDPSNLMNERTVVDNLMTQKSDGQKMDDGDWITDDEEDEEVCDLEMAFREELKKKRLPMNSKEKNFICEVCGKQYSKNHLLREHIVRNHQDHQQAKKYPYQCAHCKRVYSGEKQLQTHQIQFSGPCEICGVVVGCSGLFWYHRKNHEAECHICNKVFSAKATLIMHMKSKHMEKKVSCPECPRKFTFESQMSKHMQNVHSHGEMQEFTCKDCDFVTNRKTALRAHERTIHKIRKVYSCNECEGTFKRRSSLENHKCSQLQGGQIQFSCHICLKSFMSYDELTSHEKSAHSIQVTVGMPSDSDILTQSISAKTFACQVCHTKFSSAKSLRVHALKFHGFVIQDSKDNQEVQQESIHITEANEAEVAIMHIDVNNEVNNQSVVSNEVTKEDDSILGLDTTGDGFPAIRSALSLPAYVVPPDVNMVEIDGVQYHVIRGNQ